MLINALVWLLVVLVLAAIVFFALSIAKFQEPWDRLIKLVMIAIIVVVILYKFLPILSVPIR